MCQLAYECTYLVNQILYYKSLSKMPLIPYLRSHLFASKSAFVSSTRLTNSLTCGELYDPFTRYWNTLSMYGYSNGKEVKATA